MFQRKSLKISLIVYNLVFLFIVSQINFSFLQRFKILGIPLEDAEVIKSQIKRLILGTLVFVILFDFYFLTLERELKEEENKIKSILKLDPQNQIAKEKLEKIEKKEFFHATLVEFIFTIAIGIVIGFPLSIVLSYFFEMLK